MMLLMILDHMIKIENDPKEMDYDQKNNDEGEERRGRQARQARRDEFLLRRRGARQHILSKKVSAQQYSFRQR